MNPRLKEELREFLPRSLRRHRIWGGPLRGSAIVTSWHDYPAAILGRTERALLHWFRENVRVGETWLDIGAHYGYTAIALCRLVGTSGRVFAFEPMLNTAGCVSRTSFLNKLPQLTVIPMALGDCADLALGSLHVVKGMIDSTLAPSSELKEHFMVARLDWLWPKIAGADSRIDGIKIDVQGMELKVLEGMTEVARGNRPKLLVEVHKGVSRARLLEVIAAIGYEPQGAAVEPQPDELEPHYADDRTYFFRPAIEERH